MVSKLFSEDKAAIRRLLAGDEASFLEFFDTQAPRLYRFALGRVNFDADLAEEIVQAVLIKAIPKLETYRGEAAISTWLCTFCVREIAAHYRKQGRRPVNVELSEEIREVREALERLRLGEDDDPEQRMLRREVAGLVQTVIDLLPGHYGDALEWKYVQGLTVREISARLAITPIAVQSLLARARRAFRESLDTLGAQLSVSTRQV